MVSPENVGERTLGFASAVSWRGMESGPMHAVAGEPLELTVVALTGEAWDLLQGGACAPTPIAVEHEVEGDVVRIRVVDELECGDVWAGDEVSLEVQLPALPVGRYTLEVDNGFEEAETRALYVGAACDAPPEALAGAWDWVGGAVSTEERSLALMDSQSCAAVGTGEVFAGLTVLPDGFFLGTVHTDFDLEGTGCLRIDGDEVVLESESGQREFARDAGRRCSHHAACARSHR